MRRFIFFFLLLSIHTTFFSQFSFAEDLISITISVTSQNNTPVSNAVVKIGDLSETTNDSGIVNFSVFPTLYDINISRPNYKTLKSTIDITASSKSFTYKIDSNFTPVNVKIIDSLTGFPVVTSIKATNNATQISSFSYSNESGEILLELEKNSIYILEVEEKNYITFSRNLDTGKLLSSSIIFKLERLDSEATFNFNSLDGTLSFRVLPSDTLYKEYRFKGKSISVNIPFGKYEVDIVSNGYKILSKIVNINKKIYTESFSLVPNYRTYNFLVAAGDESVISFPKDMKLSSFPVIMKNTTLNFFLNDVLEKSFTYDGSISKVDIPYGVYDIEVKNNLSDSYTVENIEFSETSPENILFSLKQFFTSIKGFVKLGTYFIGGVNVTFTDNTGNEYNTLSDIDGSYSIKLPARNYSVNADKDGYTIRDKKPIPISASLPNETYTCDIDIEELRSIVTGRITALDGSPVANARITIKLDKDETVTYSDINGKYSASVNSGLVFIKIDKPGFKSKGNVKTVNKFSTITGLDFSLEELFISIDGVVTNGVSPLGGISIKLLDNNKQTISKIASRDDGSFIFNNVKTINNYYITVDDNNYFQYISNEINIKNDSIKGYNITLQKNSLSVIIEVKDKQSNPLIGSVFIIDGTPYKTDITGFIELEYTLKESTKKISITSPDNNYASELELSDKMISPLKKEIIITK